MDRDGAPLDLDQGGHLCWLPDIKTMMNMPKKEQQKYLWKILWLMYKNPPSMVGCCGCCEGKSLLLFPAPTNCHKIVESGVEQDGENIISSISHSVDWNLGGKSLNISEIFLPRWLLLSLWLLPSPPQFPRSRRRHLLGLIKVRYMWKLEDPAFRLIRALFWKVQED